MVIFIVIPLEIVDWNDFIVPERLILASFTGWINNSILPENRGRLWVGEREII
jgi:hypothetical protein